MNKLIRKKRIGVKKEITDKNRLSSVCPEILEYWDYNLNSHLSINPENTTHSSPTKVHWRCKKGHSWEAVIRNMVSSLRKKSVTKGCPYCDNKKANETNCLATTNPKLAKEWNYEKNVGITPHMVTAGSDKKFWWKCKDGHEWQDKIKLRNNGKGCPYRQDKGVTDKNRLTTTNPELCKYWNYEKNKGVNPEDLSYGSTRVVWWVCENGHEYKSKIKYKTISESGQHFKCKKCSKLLTKESCLLFANPNVAKEWDYNENGDLNPRHVYYGSPKKVWWKCKKGHKWKTTVSSRTKGKTNCPYCSNKKVNIENCLKTTNPNLAKEWDYKKNKKITPYNVTSGSNKKAWWKCKFGHKWNASISIRNGTNKKNKKSKKGSGCPYCSNQKFCMGHSLLVNFPSISKEWHPTKNGNLMPNNIVYGHKKRVWWKCKKGHEWITGVVDRTRSGSCCPKCNKISLKDGMFFDSLPEAYFYLKKIKGKYKKVVYQKKYGGDMGRRTCDFYIPKTKTYYEITSFGQNNKKSKFWKKYRKNILKKKKYVENVLGSKFKFVQIQMTYAKIQAVLQKIA